MLSACYTGTICSILAIIFGCIGISKARRGLADNLGVALAGVLLGIVGVGLMLMIIAFVVVMAATTS